MFALRLLGYQHARDGSLLGLWEETHKMVGINGGREAEYGMTSTLRIQGRIANLVCTYVWGAGVLVHKEKLGESYVKAGYK